MKEHRFANGLWVVSIWILLAALGGPAITAAEETYTHYDSTTSPSAALETAQDVFLDAANNRVLIATGVWGFLDTRDYYSDRGRGILILDRTSDTFTSYSTINGLPTNNYISITGGDGLIVAGSYNEGITVIDDLTGNVTVYKDGLKLNVYTDKTAPISDVHYENGQVYFAYGSPTEQGVFGGVVDLISSAIDHYTYPGRAWRSSALTVTDELIYFAGRYITAFDKETRIKIYHREDNADTTDWGPDARFIAFDPLADRLYVGDTAGERFTDAFGLRIYDGALQYVDNWDMTPSSHPTQMLDNNVTALHIDVSNRRLYVAHNRWDAVPGLSAEVGNVQVIDLDNQTVMKNFVSENEDYYDSWEPTPIKLLPPWSRATFRWQNTVTAIANDDGDAIFLTQTADGLSRQAPGDGGGLGVIEPDNTPPTAVAGGPYSVAEGGEVPLDGSGSYDEEEGGTLVYEWDFDEDGEFDDAAGIAPAFSAQGLDGPNTKTVSLRVTDDAGASGVATANVHVVNVAPTIDTLTAPIAPVNITAQPVSVEVAFSDPGTDTYNVTWIWGDGTPDSAAIGAISPASSDHTYAAPGVYTLQVSVTDDDGGDTTASGFIVVYDPDGGFVTGGGWIDSPAGAYAPEPSLTGKATFGFVSKYKKGKTTPTGNTQFRFQAGDLNFHSDNYDWLVVAGHKAMYKGVGTVNGGGNYGFMLSAIDESLTPSTDVDMFRIRIWDKDNGDAIVYDNQTGDAEDADPTTQIGGGNIAIHKK